MSNKSWCPKCDDFHPHAPCVEATPMTDPSRVSEELVRSALKAGDEADIDWSSPTKHWDYMVAALNTVSDRLKADGLREAAVIVATLPTSGKPHEFKHELLNRASDAILARADALDPPKETK